MQFIAGHCVPRRYVAAAVLALCSSLFATPCEAQGPSVTNQIATPMPGGHDYIHMLNETVNPANGSVSLRITLPSPPGRGLSFPLVVNYDSAGVWIATPPWQNSGALEIMPGSASYGGWTTSIPVLQYTQTNVPVTDPTSGAEDQSTCAYFSSFAFQDVTGDRHSLPLVVFNDQSTTDGNCELGSQVLQGGDDSVTATMVAPGEVKVAEEDGTIYDFQVGMLTCPPKNRPEKMRLLR